MNITGGGIDEGELELTVWVHQTQTFRNYCA